MNPMTVSHVTITESTASEQATGKRKEIRRGAIAARIGSQQPHRLGIGFRWPNGTEVKAGTIIHQRVEELHRVPDELLEHAKWICKFPDCRGQHWPSKKALLEAHPPIQQMRAQEETHLYYAVIEIPASAGGKDKAAQPAVVKLLSDEE